jgi:hypothetical protein
MPRFERPRASTIGTPIYHRRRRDWKDDRDLIEEVATSVNKLNGPYEYYDKGVFAFREKIKTIRATGYENNIEVTYLGMWIREELSKIAKTQASYDLRVHTLKFPEQIDSTILRMEQKAKVNSNNEGPGLSIESLFPDPTLRRFAMERTQILHKGDLVAYLSSLVSKERDSLLTNSASIMDLIQICENNLTSLDLIVKKRYAVGETDLWIPSVGLGVEIRNTWDSEDEIELIRVLSDTNFRLQTRHLVVVTPDELSNETFSLLRGIETRQVIENLSIIRIGDFNNYITKIKDIEENNF